MNNRAPALSAARSAGQTLQWVATDTAPDAGAWFVERWPDRATYHPGTQPTDVTVSGPARSLLLILTDLARHWLDNTAHVSG